MVAMPVMKDATTPIMKLTSTIDGLAIMRGILTRAAPKIIGVDNKKENLAALDLVSPSKSPAVMVMPDRETPGIIASICARPISTLVFKVIPLTSIFCLPFLSAK